MIREGKEYPKYKLHMPGEFDAHPKCPPHSKGGLYTFGVPNNNAMRSLADFCPLPFYAAHSAGGGLGTADYRTRFVFYDPDQPVALDYYANSPEAKEYLNYRPLNIQASRQQLAEMQEVLGIDPSRPHAAVLTTVLMMMSLLMHHGHINRFEEVDELVISHFSDITTREIAELIEKGREYWRQCERSDFPVGRNPNGEAQMEDPSQRVDGGAAVRAAAASLAPSYEALRRQIDERYKGRGT